MAHILKLESVKELKGNLSLNKNKYHSESKTWISQYFKGKDYLVPNAINLSRVDLLSAPGEENRTEDRNEDIENIKRFYIANKHLTLEEVADARLWTYLTHETYYSYTKNRWVRKENSDIQARFFYSLRGMGKIRNSIARLWWYGKFTYDENLEDPFELLYDFIQDTDYIEQFYGRNFHKNHNLARRVLKALNIWKKEGNTYPKRDNFRKITTEINRKGAYSVIDNMDVNEIKEIIKKVCSKKEKV